MIFHFNFTFFYASVSKCKLIFRDIIDKLFNDPALIISGAPASICEQILLTLKIEQIDL